MAAKSSRARKRRSGRPGARPPQRGATRRVGTGAATRPRPVVAPAGSPLRRRIEHASLPLVTRLYALPRWLLPIVVGAILFVGLFVSGPGGAAALAAVTAFFVWMGYLSWQAVGPVGRLARVVAVGILAALTVWRIVG